MAKLGAAMGVFLFPILQSDLGTSALLFCIAGTCMLAFAVTYALRIEPRGRSLDDVSGRTLMPRLTPVPHPVPP